MSDVSLLDVSPFGDVLTVREVARKLRVDQATVRRWIVNGTLEAVELPHVGNRRSYRVKRSTLDALLGNTPQPNVSSQSEAHP